MTINRALQALLVSLIIVFSGVIAWSLRDTTAKEGSRAPDFSIKADNGQQITPKEFGGKVLVLNFWATWCQPCVQEIPSLNEFQKKYGNSGVVVLAVSVDKNEGKYKNFLRHVHVIFDTTRDPNADLSARYGTFQYPESYIIKNGQVMRKFAEGKDWTSDDVDQYVRSLL